ELGGLAGLVELRLIEANRQRVESLRLEFARDGRQSARIDTTGEEDPERNVRVEVKTHRMSELVSERTDYVGPRWGSLVGFGREGEGPELALLQLSPAPVDEQTRRWSNERDSVDDRM